VAALQISAVDRASNPDFDRAKGILETFYRESTTGNCGSFARWHWTGREFELALLRKMPVCGGVALADWPILYRRPLTP
jgi:hypothetical protein